MVLWSLSSLPLHPSDTLRKSPLPLISVSFILFTHLHPGPPPSHLCTQTRPVCRHTFRIMLHIQANCAAKGIISVHCRKPVNQSSLCFHHRAPPPTHTHTHTHPQPRPCRLFPSAHLQCACRAGSYCIRIPAHFLLSGPT